MALLTAGNGKHLFRGPEFAFGYTNDEVRLPYCAIGHSKAWGRHRKQADVFGSTDEQIPKCMTNIAANPQAWGVVAEYIRSPGIKEATERVISQMQV